jgi:hypothetical protein
MPGLVERTDVPNPFPVIDVGGAAFRTALGAICATIRTVSERMCRTRFDIGVHFLTQVNFRLPDIGS